MSIMRWGGLLATLGIVALASAATDTAMAQDQKAPQKTPGSTWNAEVSKDAAVTGISLDDKQVETIKKINVYFNNLDNAQGRFVQITADAKRMRGKFFVKRPGLFRFEYASPSRQVILSDGKHLVIEDHDAKKDDKYWIDQTPFRILLRKDVDLLRDARILEFQETSDLVVITIQDKSGEASGRIRLFMAMKPAIELKEWLVTDAQGSDTRMELSDIKRDEVLDGKLFQASNIGLERAKGNN